MAEKSCATFLLCDLGWCLHKSDVQNKGDENAHTQYDFFTVQYLKGRRVVALHSAVFFSPLLFFKKLFFGPFL